MRFGKISVFAAFIYASVANAQDVMVDLSVLDNLETSKVNISKPLFPVLPKKTNIKIEKSKPKVIKKKNKPKKVVERAKTINEDIVVVDVEPVLEAVKTDIVISKNVKDEDIKPVVKEIKNEEITVAPVAEEKITVAPKAEISEDIPALITEEAVAIKPTSDLEDTNKNDLIIKEEKTIDENDNYIKFDDDVDDLNDEQISKIDSIVSKYKNEPTNKIAIYSYNFDSGVDSFKKKRISLNRAVEVRSYLLKKGYKNFSIKVININNLSDKLNTVELQEI